MRSPCSRRALPQWHPRPSRAQATAHKTRALCVHAPPAAGQVVKGYFPIPRKIKKSSVPSAKSHNHAVEGVDIAPTQLLCPCAGRTSLCDAFSPVL